jgi:hypothetical protein
MKDRDGKNMNVMLELLKNKQEMVINRIINGLL